MSLSDLGGGLGGLFSSGPSLQRFSTLNKQQKGVSEQLAKYFGSRLGQPMEQYSGQTVAPMSQYEQQGLGYLGDYLGGMGGYMPQRQAAYAKALGGQMLAPIDTAQSRAAFEQNVVPMYQGHFQRFAAPAKEEIAAMGGGVSSSAMNRAVADVGGDLSRYLSDLEYQRMLSEEQASRQREEQNAQYQLAAMSATEPERAEQLSMTQASQQYGQLPRQLEQMQLTAAMQEWLRTRPEYSPVINQALQYLGTQMQGTYMQDNPGLLAKWSGAWNEIGMAMSAPIQAFNMPMQSAYNLGSSFQNLGSMGGMGAGMGMGGS